VEESPAAAAICHPDEGRISCRSSKYSNDEQRKNTKNRDPRRTQMPIEVVMPRLGWTMEAGTVVEWLKQSGDPVEAGELLFAVESDKAITEVEALDSGILYLPPDAPIGAEVPVGATVGYLLAPGEAMPAAGSQQSAVSQSVRAGGALTRESALATNHPISRKGEGAGGEAVSPRARRVAAELSVDLSQVSGTGSGGRIREADVRAAAKANGARPRVSPTVRRMAEQTGVDLAGVAPSGPAGRITRADLTALTPVPSPVREPVGVDPRVYPSGVRVFRHTIAARMAEAAHTTAPVTLTTEVDATELVRVREQLKNELTGSGSLLPSYNDLLIRLAARALRLHPDLNASLDGDDLVLHENIHIGLAVDTDRGLLVPVVRDAGRLGLFDIAAETARLIEKTRDGSITREEMTSGTFTITNLGMYSIDAFTPIINLPEAAVLGVGRIVAKPVVIDEDAGEIAVRKMLSLSLTFDHRVVDGAPAARFLQQLGQMVEHPLRWLM
jgi:pyruvate dehydrogenase E2 component (dihydrolipoamide acetyltransferase)